MFKPKPQTNKCSNKYRKLASPY